MIIALQDVNPGWKQSPYTCVFIRAIVYACILSLIGITFPFLWFDKPLEMYDNLGRFRLC